MSSMLPLQINLVHLIPLEGYELIGTLTNQESYYGYQIQGYTVKFFKDKKMFEISLENYESTFFSQPGRFKIYKNVNVPSQLIAIIHSPKGSKRAKSHDSLKSRSTVYIPSDALQKRSESLETIKN